ncbi:hypothetical protein VUJ46_13010 [Chryseobacterium sp. MYb264]|uniref:hypothetical protein n=1 Tax=Chryseobacterium sp. MYb264 TaxID=2745153 RepID=UPI002E0DC0BC|nr:hypothetical protein VUJ46_13010 [Chryseobacterium sp. MYb264]
MTKRFISRLCFSAVFTFLVQSCVHDEVNSNTLETIEAPSSAYASKSLWKEDEKYIKNVMKVFNEYADRNYFTSNFGTVYWDYALTFGTFNESYLEVPVIKNNKVSFIMVVYRENDRVFFKRKEDTASDEFFNALVFNDRSKYKIEANNGALNTAAKGCISTVTTWTWTNEDGSAGPTFQYTTISCTPVGPKLPCQSVDPDDANCGGSVGNNPGGGPGGGGGYPYPSQVLHPCQKGKDLLDPAKGNVKTLITNGMYNYINNSSTGEAGIYLKKDSAGNITTEVAPYTAGAALAIQAGGTYYSAIHTHPTDTYPMFSWSDIYALYTLEMKAASYNNGQSSLTLVCQDDNGVKQTYVIMFENIGQYMEDIFNNPENIGCTHEQIKKRMDATLKEKYEKESEKTNPDYESIFLQMNFGTNVGLYKANSDITGFSKLQIASNIPNALVQSINCN